MKKFKYSSPLSILTWLSVLSFIILLCFEDAQGQFLSRPGLHFQNRRRAADYFRHQHSSSTSSATATSAKQSLNRNKKHTTRRKNSSGLPNASSNPASAGLVVKNEVCDALELNPDFHTPILCDSILFGFFRYLTAVRAFAHLDERLIFKE